MQRHHGRQKNWIVLLGILVWSCLVSQLAAATGEAETSVIINTEGIRTIELALGKLARLEFTRPVMRAHIANEEVAEIRHFSREEKGKAISTQLPNWIFFRGKNIGTTQLTVWDAKNRIMGTFDITIIPDVVGLKKNLHDIFPGEKIEVTTSANSIILSGMVSSTAKLAKAVELAESFIPDKGNNNKNNTSTVPSTNPAPKQDGGKDKFKVINMLQVGGVQQVMLEVHIAEMSRQLGRQLGINFAATGGNSLGLTMLDNMTATGGISSSTTGLDVGITDSVNAMFSFFGGDEWLGVFIDAMQEEGLLKILAEPTLIALSGQKASFLAGGEFPVPVPQTYDRTTIEWKPFGVALNFTPVVLGEEHISMEVAPEVSDLDFTRAVTISNYVIPSVDTRRMSTVVELKDGQSFAVAGLLKNIVREDIKKFPVLGDIPVLGALFRSSEFERNETELVILVTPHLVRPLDLAQQPLPTDSFVEPNGFEFLLLGQLEGQPQGLVALPSGTTSGSAKRPGGAGPGMEGDFGYILPE